mgnify:CR=1 FL=1
MPKVKHNRPMYLGYDERCGYCKNDMTHTGHDHDKAVTEKIRRESKREDALWNQARKQYDNP